MSKQPHNAANPKHVADAQARATERRRLELADMKQLLGTPHGRRIAWRWLDKAGVYRTSFTGNSSTFFNEGQRNMGLLLLADIHEACPEQYAVMLEEARQDKEREQGE